MLAQQASSQNDLGPFFSFNPSVWDAAPPMSANYRHMPHVSVNGDPPLTATWVPARTDGVQGQRPART